MANANLTKKIVYYQHSVTGMITPGFPEQFPAPPFYNKIVCHTAHESEMWSQKIREQEKLKERLIDEERDHIEGEMIRNLRSHMHHQMANARNQMNRDFMRIAMEKIDSRKSKTKTTRESYMHAEAYEHGK